MTQASFAQDRNSRGHDVGVRLTDDEAWRLLETAHTGVFTTLRRDGSPISLPVWFVVDGRSIGIAAPTGTKKLERIRNDPEAGFLVEGGRSWRELWAVHMNGTAQILPAGPDGERIAADLDEKYADFRAPTEDMPASARRAYERRTIIRFVPDARVLTWDNRKLD